MTTTDNGTAGAPAISIEDAAEAAGVDLKSIPWSHRVRMEHCLERSIANLVMTVWAWKIYRMSGLNHALLTLRQWERAPEAGDD